MNIIKTLGPKGTYSDLATKKFLNNNENYKIEYYPSILKTITYLNDNEYAIIPIENTLDGFVVEGLDQIIANKYCILQQLKLDIDFAFVSNSTDIKSIKYCYSQFKAYGQCLDFISKYNFNIIRTESNTESLNRLLESNDLYSAIIPIHLLDDFDFKTEILHVADSKNNETRFFVISKNHQFKFKSNNLESSIVVEAHEDRPGILYDILSQFHSSNINLKSIMSRPLKTEMGKYKFYVECSIDKSMIDKLNELKKNIELKNNASVDILGIYDTI